MHNKFHSTKRRTNKTQATASSRAHNPAPEKEWKCRCSYSWNNNSKRSSLKKSSYSRPPTNTRSPFPQSQNKNCSKTKISKLPSNTSTVSSTPKPITRSLSSTGTTRKLSLSKRFKRTIFEEIRNVKRKNNKSANNLYTTCSPLKTNSSKTISSLVQIGIPSTKIYSPLPMSLIRNSYPTIPKIKITTKKDFSCFGPSKTQPFLKKYSPANSPSLPANSQSKIPTW